MHLLPQLPCRSGDVIAMWSAACADAASQQFASQQSRQVNIVEAKDGKWKFQSPRWVFVRVSDVIWIVLLVCSCLTGTCRQSIGFNTELYVFVIGTSYVPSENNCISGLTIDLYMEPSSINVGVRLAPVIKSGWRVAFKPNCIRLSHRVRIW